MSASAPSTRPPSRETLVGPLVGTAPRRAGDRDVGPHLAGRGRDHAARNRLALVRTTLDERAPRRRRRSLSRASDRTSRPALLAHVRATLPGWPRRSTPTSSGAKYREERDKRLRPDGNAQYLEPTGKFAHYRRRPVRDADRARSDRRRAHGRADRRRLLGAVHRRALEAGRASTTCASSRAAATSAARGTGTAIPARCATPRRWCTCRCSKRPATCRRRSTSWLRRSSGTRSASRRRSVSTTMRSSRRR